MSRDEARPRQHDDGAAQNQAHERGRAIGQAQQPEHHQQHHHVDVEVPFAGPISVSTLDQHGRSEEQPENQTQIAERVLVGGDPDVDHLVGPAIVASAKIRQVLDEQDRDGNQEIAAALEQTLHRPDGIELRHHDQRHHDVPDDLVPSLERRQRKVGPQDADRRVDEEQRDPRVVLEELAPRGLPREQNEEGRDDQDEEGISIDRASFEEGIRRVKIHSGAKPLRRKSRSDHREPGDGYPQRQRDARTPPHVADAERDHEYRAERGCYRSRH